MSQPQTKDQPTQQDHRSPEDEEKDEQAQKKTKKQEEKAEVQEAEERSAPTGKVIYRSVLSEGEKELKRPTAALFWSGVAAGLSMGFSMIMEGLMHTYLPDAPWRPLVAQPGLQRGLSNRDFGPAATVHGEHAHAYFAAAAAPHDENVWQRGPAVGGSAGG